MSPVLLCAATALEARACRSAIREARMEESIEVLRTGMGLHRARTALEARLSGGPLPAWVISTGFAGCRSATLRVGQWVFARTVSLESGRKLELAEAVPPFFRPESDSAIEADFISLSGVEILESPDDAEATETPVIVDMESFAWAEAATARGIRFQALRIVSDTPADPLPAVVAHLVAVSTGGNWRARARAALQGGRAAATDPRSLGRFARRTSRLSRLMTEGWVGFLREGGYLPSLIPKNRK